jgi:hypothetical protein
LAAVNNKGGSWRYLAVQHFDHKQPQELLFGQGGNQHRKRGAIGCGAFLAVYQIKCPLLSKWRPIARGLLYIWTTEQGQESRNSLLVLPLVSAIELAELAA